jgi:mono/diheme cytochrome c family protein
MIERMPPLLGTALFCALAGFLAACTANQQPSKIETTLANAAKDVVIPLEARDLKNPLPSNDQVLGQGEQAYMAACGMCHGNDGHARTDLGRGMYPPAMDLTSPHVQHWTDAELFWIIQNGVRMTGMPSWKSTISETDTWKLVHYIQNLPRLNAAQQAKQATSASSPAVAKPEAELIAYGKTLYRQEGCFTCHRLDGEGTKVGPDLSVEGTRGRAREWLIGHFKDPPAYTRGSMMPPFTNLTGEQLAALSAFLENQKGPKH